MVGDPIAFVVAERHGAGRAELVEADDEPAVVDVEQALQPGAGVVWDNAPGNEAFRKEVGDKEATEAAFRSAHRTVSLRVNQRLVPNPMETRGGRPLGAGRSSSPCGRPARSAPPAHEPGHAGPARHRVRVIVPEVGGGFGCKLNIYAEEALTARAAMLVNRPVKWIEDRREVSRHHPRAGADGLRRPGAGQRGAHRGPALQDHRRPGGYAQVNTESSPPLQPRPLRLRHPRPLQRADRRLHHLPDAGGRAGVHLVERVVDVAAREAGIDPPSSGARTSSPRRSSFPSKAGVEYSGGLRAGPRPGPWRSPATPAAGGAAPGQRRSAGASCWGSASPATSSCPALTPPRTGEGSAGRAARCASSPPAGDRAHRRLPTGRARRRPSQIVSDEFGVPLEDVIVVHGDTATVQYGMGTYGSRSTAVGARP